MMTTPPEGEFSALIPELQSWNGGAGIAPEAWISGKGNYDLAIGYSLIFWPRFVLIDDYVLRDGATAENLRSWEEATAGDPRAVEAVINHLHIADIHFGSPDPTEAQLRYLGRTLAQIYEVKLRLDFPNRIFKVTFPDEPGLNLLAYELTFWQVRD